MPVKCNKAGKYELCAKCPHSEGHERNAECDGNHCCPDPNDGITVMVRCVKVKAAKEV
jgi:hypothetical protein